MAIKVRAKAAKKDFLPEELPQTRRSQFFEILKSRYGLIFKCGFILFLFGIILIIASTGKSIYNSNFRIMLSKGEIDEVTCNNYIGFTNFITSLVYVPGFILLMTGLAGITRIMRQLVLGEGILFKQEFKLGLKNNFKQFALFGFVFSAIYVFFNYLLFVYSNNSAASVVITVFLTIYLTIGLCYLFVFVIYSNIYTSKGFELARNVLMCLGKGKFPGISYILLSILPIILTTLLTTGILFGIMIVIYFLLLLPIIVLIGNSFFSNIFDDLFNYSQYPKLVKKGLYISDSEKKLINKIHLRKYKEIEQKLAKSGGNKDDEK